MPGELAYRMKLGLPVELIAPGQPPYKAQGTVSFIAPSLDRQSQTLLVKATFDNPDGLMRDQQRVSAVLSFGSKTLLSVPVGAVLLQLYPRRTTVHTVSILHRNVYKAPVKTSL